MDSEVKYEIEEIKKDNPLIAHYIELLYKKIERLEERIK